MVLAFIASATGAFASHDKSDIIRLSDGSVLYGEIKGAQGATLRLKTSGAGTLDIQWRYVTGIISKYEYRIELEGGVLRFGSLAAADEPGRFVIMAATGPVEVGLEDVVSLLPIEEDIAGRFDGSVSFGFTYTHANESLQYNLGAEATYRTRKFIGSLTGQSIFNTQQGGETTNQHYTDLVVSEVIKAGWGAFQLSQIQSNPDQGFNLRFILGGGATHYFEQSSFKLINANVGIVYNRENVVDSSDVGETAELLIGASYRKFKHSTHTPRVRLTLSGFKDVQSSTRYRVIFNSELSWKIIGDFTFDLQFNDTYDSEPPGEGAKKNDFSFVTSIGFTF